MYRMVMIVAVFATVLCGCNTSLKTASAEASTQAPQTFNLKTEMVPTQDYFNYQFVDGDCDTGRHTFGNRDEMCAGLFDETLNHFCAWDQRRDYYYQQCE